MRCHCGGGGGGSGDDIDDDDDDDDDDGSRAHVNSFGHGARKGDGTGRTAWPQRHGTAARSCGSQGALRERRRGGRGGTSSVGADHRVGIPRADILPGAFMSGQPPHIHPGKALSTQRWCG